MGVHQSSSEDDLSSQLDLSRTGRGRVQQPSVAGRLLIEAGAATKGYIVGRSLEICMIQDIEGLNPELEIECLRDSRYANIFEERYISFDEAWPDKLISPLVSLDVQAEDLTIDWRSSALITERSDGGTNRDSRKHKAVGIDVVEPCRLVASVDRIAVWNDVGERTETEALLPENISCLYEGKGNAGTCEDDSTDLPTAGNCFRNAAAATGQLIKDICREVLSNVKVACSLAHYFVVIDETH